MKLSVRVITFNHLNFIHQCLDSILAQKTNFDYEIVIGDDCSTDGTIEVLKDYQKKYPKKIKLILQAKNLGGRYNLLSTLSQCEGKYIAWLDGDDYWINDNKLQLQIDFLDQNKDYSICFHNCKVVKKFDINYEENSNKNQYFETKIEDIITKGWFIMTASMVTKNINPIPNWFLNPINKNIDYSTQLYLSLNGKVHYIPELMAVYRIHEQSLSVHFKEKEWHNSILYIFKNINQLSNNQYIEIINERRFSLNYRLLRLEKVCSINYLKYLINYLKFKNNLKLSDITFILKYTFKEIFN